MSGTLEINQLVKRYGGLLATDHLSLSLARASCTPSSAPTAQARPR
jgi:ABC-type branched-subunit amino acid transport system ATPase component